jgi:hypothetical protein
MSLQQQTIDRQTIIHALSDAYFRMPFIHALWEGGSAAFNRVDEFSDLDLHAIIDDEHIREVFELTETTLAGLSPITLKYEVPEPTWHGHSQTFYRLRDTSKYFMVDLALMKLSNPNRFLEPEMHGQARVLFDKSGLVVPPVFDWERLEKSLRERLAHLRTFFDLFEVVVEKEILRSNPLDAQAFYQRFTIQPLVEVLRMKYDPPRYQFHMRYLYYDLPQPVAHALEELVFPVDLLDLAQKRQRALAWFEQTWEELNSRATILENTPNS